MRKLTILFFLILLLSCSNNHDLRGESKNSPDNQTYLIVANDNGAECGYIYVDGAIWNHKIGEAGKITPGIHNIACADNPIEAKELEIGFIIKEGTIFKFNYWGP